MVDLERARKELRSHSLSSLFIHSLAWSSPLVFTEAIYPLKQCCVPIAQRDRRTVWQVILAEKTRFTSALRYQLYSAIWLHEQTPNRQTPNPAPVSTTPPLVIIADAKKTRSLWCVSPFESALYVGSQPLMLWDYRLRQLAVGNELFPTFKPENESRERFEQLLTQLSEGVNGIEDIAHRRTYATLTLRRLMLIQQIQQKGWLADDTWYLQSRFSAFSQHCEQGEASFFEACLQPLYQSLSLPEIERPIALQTQVGKAPFLGGLFHPHRLEAAYSGISIEAAALEEVLGWLSEQAIDQGLDPWRSGALGYWLAQSVGESADLALGRRVCDRTLDNLIQQQLQGSYSTESRSKKSERSPKAQTLNDRLFNADARQCRRLIQDILPALRILDPACGSGQRLAAFHHRLTEIFSILSGYIQQNQDAQLKIWRSGLLEATEDNQDSRFVQNIQKRILSSTLCGVDSSTDAIENARLYLAMHWVAMATEPAEIEPLIDLDFNLLSGNTLVGFITVDEERFDRINQAGSESVLQGNLLQPLAADSYQMILSEKNIALEHYQSRTVLLAAFHSVPSYARMALLKEEISLLDQKAQQKLDRLLFDHMSQQLGIRYRITQLEGKPRHRPLSLQDIERLQPFHFGYHFSSIIRRGGFDIVVCQPPEGWFSPTVTEFVEQFPTLARRHNLSEQTLKTSKPALMKTDGDVAAAWMDYRDQYAYAASYLRRSKLYACQNLGVGKSARTKLARERLFVERCSRLLTSNGFGAVALSGARWHDLGTDTLLLLQKLGADSELEVAEETAVVAWQQKRPALMWPLDQD